VCNVIARFYLVGECACVYIDDIDSIIGLSRVRHLLIFDHSILYFGDRNCAIDSVFPRCSIVLFSSYFG
jgi:hypothetical protein